MELVNVMPQSVAAHIESAGPEAIARLRRQAEPLQGVRVLHVNATPTGGGVAEMLSSAIPLMQDLGLAASWRTIVAEPAFFAVTKAIHNALQGAPRGLTPEEQAIYLEWQRRNAASLTDDYDVIVVHDPQPLGLPLAAGRGNRCWIWRLHVDSSQPNPGVWSFLLPNLSAFDLAVFTMPQFVPTGVDDSGVRISMPAIDPLALKNRPIPHARALGILAGLGLDPGRPLIAQISRLDPWKDPTGVIDAYRMVKRSVPGLQLALVGVIAAQDDPEAVAVAGRVRAHADGDPDIHIYTDPQQVGPEEVAAVQQAAQVIFQKSLREGFGLTVTEALWKATPVIGGRVGGIPLQLEDGIGGFLVDSVEQAAERAAWLLANPPEARSIAVRGRDRVRSDFLITRFLADELRFYADVLGLQIQAAAD